MLVFLVRNTRRDALRLMAQKIVVGKSIPFANADAIINLTPGRCESTGSTCVYSDGQQLRCVLGYFGENLKNAMLKGCSRNKNACSKPSLSRPERGCAETGSVFDALPPATLDCQYEDESEKVLQLHRNVFGGHTQENPKCCTPPARQSDDAKKTPKKPSLSMSQANQMVQSFCRRNEFFPFVVLSENTTAEELSQQRPFLLLSILVVTSDVNPVLQKSLDERFRKVVATRIVMQGEKSMDYLQGLITYLAWFVRYAKRLL